MTLIGAQIIAQLEALLRRAVAKPWLATAALLSLCPAPACAQHDASATLADVAAGEQQDVVMYDASVFARYQPNTALDMVKRLPAFIIDDGADKRGFGAAAGNVLFNDRYPSAKQDKPSDILERIPASRVERIDLIRGQVRGIDLRRQAVVASVILHDDVPVSGRWDLVVRKTLKQEPLTVKASASLSDTWQDLEYNVGANWRRFRSGENGSEQVFDADGSLLNDRERSSFLRGDEGGVNLNLQTWLGATIVSVNTRFGFEERIDRLSSLSLQANDEDDFFVDERNSNEIEFGADAERTIGPDLLAKGILLYTRRDDDRISSQQSLDADAVETLFRVADSNVVESEAILRTEFYWSPNTRHRINLNVEGARNTIDGKLIQTVDTGSGPVEVPVPGSNTRVQEDRLDAVLNWTLYSGRFEYSYGLGAEASTIDQAGDTQNNRSFFYLKPQFSVSYSPTQERQTRFGIAREISQLDFLDFVSSTVFQDDDLALGNPDLQPQSTWAVELSEERRFGDLGALKGILFYNAISDVQDLLPLSPEFEAPGNIGDGRRWGVRLEATVPLDIVGIAHGRLDIDARFQNSSVSDPVTGKRRFLSGAEQDGKPLTLDVEARFAFALNFRQDFEAARIAWGSELRKRDFRTAFRVNELVEYREGYEFNMFAETTRWLGLKLRIEGINLLDFEQQRDRTLYVGERDLTPVDVIQLRNFTDGRRLIFSASGSF